MTLKFFSYYVWQDGLDLATAAYDICKSIVVLNGCDTGKIHVINHPTK